MNKDDPSGSCSCEELLRLTTHHARIVGLVGILRQQNTNSIPGYGSLTQVVAEEEMIREKIINYRPASAGGASIKLMYLVHFLARTKSSFDAETMASILESVNDFR
ncbi:hypothetical protein [Rhizobium sp. Root482]|uniref:hypothetical protein n=1 Tax=Rhizobium sp. Root482 TaxID=1736543 RepID=UPI0012E37D87|nr:hypothetical protein [Rhizobium sp. Root482]